MNTKVYPRTNDFQTIYLNTVIKNPAIIVGDYTIYNDFVNDPLDFEKNNVLYHYPINKDRLIIGKFCSVACGTKFLFNSANHTLRSLSNYTFPLFFGEWGLWLIWPVLSFLKPPASLFLKSNRIMLPTHFLCPFCARFLY